MSLADIFTRANEEKRIEQQKQLSNTIQASSEIKQMVDCDNQTAALILIAHTLKWRKR